MENIKDDLIVLNENPNYLCNLTDAEMKNRVDLIKNKIFSSYVGREEIENGYVFEYDNNQEIAHALLDFIIKEGSCCSSIDFDLGFRPTTKKIEFKVSTSTLNVKEFKKGIRQRYSHIIV